MKKIAVIGGGASGITAALFASGKNNKVTLFEKQGKIGRKILSTGNGRCNVSNTNIDISHYHGKNPRFVKKVFSKFGLNETAAFFESIGVPFIEEKEGRLFPESLNASSVIKIFEYELTNRGIGLKLHKTIEKISPEKDGIVLVTAGKEKFKFDRVILSAGSCASPQLGASKIGYMLAESTGHSIIQPFPSILPINIPVKTIRRLEGIKRICCLKVELNGKILTEKTGDLLFTKYGLSGTASLDISRFVNRAILEKKSPNILIDFFPDLSYEDLLIKLKKLFSLDKKKKAAFSLSGIMQNRMSEIIFKFAKIVPEVNAGSLNKTDLDCLLKTFKALKLQPGEPRSFKEAVVAAGGVDVDEIKPSTMESKKIKNMFITGELLDIDGDSGGYNLQFAWSTGAIAGMAQQYKK